MTESPSVRSRFLGEFLKEKGIEHRLQDPVESPVPVSSQNLGVGDFLPTGTLPLGLDFSLDGVTIEVDAGQEVHNAAEK